MDDVGCVSGMIAMFGKLKTKIREVSGETLVETLAAVLICGLAATVLMAALGTASSLNLDARTLADQEQRQARLAGEFAADTTGELQSGVVVFTDLRDSSLRETFEAPENLEVHGGELIVSYTVEGEGE